MSAMISKARVIEHFGSVAEVAKFFDIEVQAVYQWKDEAIPRERELELMVRLPADFGPNTSPKSAAGSEKVSEAVQP
jgi:hypothetical protein